MSKTSNTKPTSRLWILWSLASLFLVSCSNTPYQAKPLDPTASSQRLHDNAPDSADFHTFLLAHGYKQEELPFQLWGLNELTLSAIYHHPRLKVAEAQRVLASIAVDTAGLRQNPSINGYLSRSNQANGDIRPWAYGLGFDIPIETSNKRTFRLEEAQHLVDAARLDVADTVWQLRNQISQDILQYHENLQRITQLESELSLYQNIVNMLEKRLYKGLASQSEVNTYRILLQKTQFSIKSVQAQSFEIQAKLAADSGLSLEQFRRINLRPLQLTESLTQQENLLQQAQTSNALQQTALLNRTDIRRALAKYAAAEAKIQLEIAKQTPDISISPGFAFEFGDKVWALGISSLLNLVNKNQTLVAEATQLREIEATQFEALQAQIIADLTQAQVRYNAAKQALTEQQAMLTAQKKQHTLLQKKFDAGLIDNVELTLDKLNEHLATQQLQQTQFAMLNAIQQIENIMQQPLDSKQMDPTQLTQSEYTNE